MASEHDPDAREELPPEYESLMRPGAVPPRIGSGTPKHDQVTETGLSDFAGLFRDAPDAAPAVAPTVRQPAMSPPPPSPSIPPAQPPIWPETSQMGHNAASVTTPLSSSSATAHPVAVTTAPPANPQRQPALAPPRKPRRRGRGWRILLFVVAGFIAYVLALLAVFAFSVNKVAAMPTDQIADTAGSNYLLVGSDGRDNLTKKQRKALHTGYAEGQRTDTIMLLHVPVLGAPTLISIPRDSWVPIPGHGSDKINAAYAQGGAPLLIETVEKTTGVHIDHYAEVGMAGVAGIADSLGGVTLCPKANYDDQRSGLDVRKGCQEMDGKTALAYVRMRYSDPKGDIGRAERQREYINAVATKAVNPLTWLNPFRMFSFDRATASALTVDEGTGVVADMRLAAAMAMISRGWGESTSVPIETDAYWVGGQQAVKWNTPAALKLFESIGGG